MNEKIKYREQDPEYKEVSRREKKIRKFYKELANWAGVSVVLIAINMFLSGGISWAKYPVFFWGIFLAIQFFTVLRLQRMNREWETRAIRKLRSGTPEEPIPHDTAEDYSEELLRNQEIREKEPADLSDYRKIRKPWRDEDLV